MSLQPELPLKNTFKDIIIISIGSIIIFSLASSIGAFELFFEYSRSHEDMELDEIAILLIILSFALGIFSWRRWHELGQELVYRKWVEERLKIAKQQAEIANQAKSEFLANMSHELRTPLNGILGYAQILQRDTSLTDQQQDAVITIQKSGEHLLTLINDVLDLSKIEANKMELHPKDFQFSIFLETIVNIMQVRAQQDVIFNHYFDADLPIAIHGDEVRLRQILVNLLGNALKFTQQGYVNFYVHRQQDTIHFKIQDTGLGIAPDQIDTIFEPFRQVGEDTFAEGTGLGLPITQRFVKMMGGQIHVESTLGQGSCFEFSLNLPEVTQWHDEQSQKRQIIGFKGKIRKLLIVDDKATNREILVQFLSGLGFELKQCENGRQCVEEAQRFLPDGIIMDLMMPIMDGLEAVRTLRKIPVLETTPIIATSANIFKQNHSDCFDAGCNDFIASPIQFEELLEKLGTHLELQWQYTATPTETSQTIIPPPQSVIHALQQNIEEGDIEEISLHATQLIQQEEYQAFAQKLQQLADEFDLNQLQIFIESYVQ